MITSTRNSQVKYIEQLQSRSKWRRERKEFVAEGHKMVAEAPRDRLIKVYASDAFVKSNQEYMEKLDFPYETVSDMVFAQMSDRVFLPLLKCLNMVLRICLEPKDRFLRCLRIYRIPAISERL